MKKTVNLSYIYSWRLDTIYPTSAMKLLHEFAEQEISRQVLQGKSRGKLEYGIDIDYVLHVFAGDWHKV